MSPGKTYFLSDLHLGAGYFKDPKQRERAVVDFFDSIKEDAEEIFLLGDILDYWFEYKYAVPRGFIRFFGKLAELSDSGVKITWLIGNHDIWIFDYLPSELGIDVIDGSICRKINGKVFYMSHGDGIGVDSLGFRFMRAFFRNKFCQKLYSGIHPRWTIPFALGWSRSSRKGSDDYISETATYSLALEKLRSFCRRKIKDNPEIDYFIFGHLHLLYTEKISSDSEMVILGDWISKFSYAEFDGTELRLKKYDVSEFIKDV